MNSFSDSYFIYIDASSGSQNDKARIYSPEIKYSTAYCVRFFYNMNGVGMGDINLFYINKGSSFNPNWTPPFTVYKGNFGDQWIGASYSVQAPPGKAGNMNKESKDISDMIYQI